ncbi:MAG: catechol 2,3-dioxygenase-like lactoylglutathione lyase family enzyme [Hyphomicrobiaceae bacterium]|jgi:catechol 2,3-dioxygenase-like lactoylglutathione lyase family enzyme
MATLTTPEPTRHSEPTVKAQRLAYLIWERPDLDKATAFFHDFGLVLAARREDTLYFRAANTAPYCCVVRLGTQARFVGLALEVRDQKDLEHLAALPGAAPIEKLNTPGGGFVVRLQDPSGFLVEAICGQESQDELPVDTSLPANCGSSIPRVNAGHRPAVAPPTVMRLGHLVLELAEFQKTCTWYTSHFGFIPSDIEVLPDGSPAATFMRLNRGDTPTDHHSLALAQGIAPRFNHVAFEVADINAIGMGQRVLRRAGYGHAWGIGRHLLGSQIFDYWRDPWRDKFEHYADGDVFTADTPTGITAAGGDTLSQWGPPLPSDFLRPEASIGLLVEAIRNVISSPDLSIGKLRAMLKMVS